MGMKAIVGSMALLLLARVASADLLELQDGRIIEGVKMTRTVDAKAIVLHYVHGDVKVPMSRVADYVIEGVPPFTPKTAAEKAKRAKGLVPYRNHWVTPEVRTRRIRKEIEEKKAELEDYKAHRNWANPYKFQTRHFRFQSTLPPRINEEYAEIIEAYYKEFAKLWRVSQPRDWGKLDVYFHCDRRTFEDRAGVHGGVLAYYKFVPPREINFYYDAEDPARTTAVLFHEMNHYLTDLLDQRFEFPHWVNEAMAEYYGGTTWDPKKKKLTVGGIQQGRLVEVLSDMDKGKFLALKDLITSESSDYEHYTWGWSFVFFMMTSKKYSRRFHAFFSDLARARDVRRIPYQMNFTTVSGKECLRIFLSRMRVKDLSKLEKEWYAFVKKLPCSKLKGLELAGIAAYEGGYYRFRAPRLLKSAIDKGSRNVRVYFLYAQCLDLKDDEAGALAALKKACEIDPLDADAWARCGLQLDEMGKKNEGEKLLALAKEIDPDGDFRNIEIMMKLTEMGGKNH